MVKNCRIQISGEKGRGLFGTERVLLTHLCSGYDNVHASSEVITQRPLEPNSNLTTNTVL